MTSHVYQVVNECSCYGSSFYCEYIILICLNNSNPVMINIQDPNHMKTVTQTMLNICLGCTVKFDQCDT